MSLATHLARRPVSWRRRLTALVLLLTQVGIATSVALELRAEPGMSAHAEQGGATHAGVHNEATCALCAVRSMEAQSGPPTATSTVITTQAGPVTRAVITPPTRAGPSSNPSRAPPPFSA